MYHLDLLLNVFHDVAQADLLEELALRAPEVRPEFGLPAHDMVNGNWVELRARGSAWWSMVKEKRGTYETVDTGIEDRNLDLGAQWLVLSLLCSYRCKSVRHTYIHFENTYSAAQST
jgi:hypothetical protein